jgi:hypothetical protein
MFFILFLYYVFEGLAMAKPLAQLNQKIDEPDISNDVVVPPDVIQDMVVGLGIAQSNIAEPDIDQAYVTPGISVNTDKYFFNATKYKIRGELIDWCKSEAGKAGFTMVIEKSDNGNNKRKSYFVLGCERGVEK